MKVLGIESSCDETGIAVYDSDSGQIWQRLYSQIEKHREYGGVVPELASRDHVVKAAPMLGEIAAEIGSIDAIDAIAYTRGPGLMGALMVGANLARGLAWALGKPVLGVHHMEGHLLAPMLAAQQPELPFVALLVSGGHTMLVDVSAYGRYRILGESLDDAVGEAFDKTAKLLGLPYPGGPELAALADSVTKSRFEFPRPMTNRPGLEFSFSGLKTAVMRTVERHDLKTPAPGEEPGQDIRDLCAGFQKAVIDALLGRVARAVKRHHARAVLVSGGVAANSGLRERSALLSEESSIPIVFPSLALSTDNAAMIAAAGYLKWQRGESSTLGAVADVEMRLGEDGPKRSARHR